MTRKLSHILKNQHLKATINGDAVVDTPVQEPLLIRATEYRLVTAGQRLQVWVGGVLRLDYTVPAGRVVLVETEEVPD